MNFSKGASRHLEGHDQSSGYGTDVATPQKVEGDFQAPSSLVSSTVNALSPEHRKYLLRVHGTLELDPIPAMDDADPYNWPLWKVSTNGLLHKPRIMS